MKICLLIIYSDTDYYVTMKNIVEKYYSKYKSANFSFYFTQFRETQENPIELEHNTIFVKGEELYMSILDKTVKALQFINTIDNYDFLVRSNISTIVNINKLFNFLNSIPTNNIYCGGQLLTIESLNPPCGIIDTSLFGLDYIQGTSIIFSKDIVDHICNNVDKLNHSIIDDVAFGLFIKECNNNGVFQTNIRQFCASLVINSHYEDYIIFYRNRSDNRQEDLIRIESIINVLIHQ